MFTKRQVLEDLYGYCPQSHIDRDALVARIDTLWDCHYDSAAYRTIMQTLMYEILVQKLYCIR